MGKDPGFHPIFALDLPTARSSPLTVHALELTIYFTIPSGQPYTKAYIDIHWLK